MRISDWSSDVCSSDLLDLVPLDLIDTAEHLGFRLVGLRIAGGPLACVFAGRRARVPGLAAGRREVDLVRQQVFAEGRLQQLALAAFDDPAVQIGRASVRAKGGTSV